MPLAWCRSCRTREEILLGQLCAPRVDKRRASSAWPDGGPAQVAAEIESDQAILVTSVISRSEIFEADLTDEQKEVYRRLFQRPNHVEYGADSRISDKASRLRHDSRTKPGGPVLTVPDSIHLATAMILEVDEFHTFDGAGRRTRGVPLLPLSGTPLVEGLKICVPSKPPEAQTKLFES